MADRFGYGEIGLDIHPCRGCEDYDAPDGCKSNGGCGRTQTNADRIRAMTDMELAKELSRIHGTCEWCPMHDDCDGENCDGQLLDWMKQEAE